MLSTVVRHHRRVAKFLLPTLLAAGLTVLAPRDGEAQEAPGEDRWAFTAELSLTDSSGNQDLTVWTTGLSVRHLRTEIFELEIKLQARSGSSNGDQVVENYQGEMNFDFTPGHRWSPFVFTTAEHDPFKRLNVRINSGAGAKYRLYQAGSRGEAALSVAVLHSYEALGAAEPATPAPDPTQSARWDVKLNGKQELREGVSVSHSTQFQPTHGEFDDYLLNVQTGLKVLVNSHMAVSVSHEYRRDSTPAPTVEPDDRLIKAGIILQL